jgi:hypothetical protein
MPPPPDHRWRLVLRRLPTGKVPRPHALVPDAVRVLPGGTGLTPAERAAAVEAVCAAIELHEAEDSGQRDTFEAWLLCGLPVGEAARRVGIDEAAAGAYRDLFFDISERLAADPSELAFDLLPPESAYLIDPADTRTWKQWMALAGGEHVLRAYLDYLTADPVGVPTDLSRVSTAELERRRDLLWMRLMILSLAPLDTPAQWARMELVQTRGASRPLWVGA